MTLMMERRPTVGAREVINRLMELPAEISAAECDLLAAMRVRQSYADELRAAEHYVQIRTLEGKPGGLAGKNEAQRGAELADATRVEAERVRAAERPVEDARLALSALLDEFAALRSVARIIAAGAE